MYVSIKRSGREGESIQSIHTKQETCSLRGLQPRTLEPAASTQPSSTLPAGEPAHHHIDARKDPPVSMILASTWAMTWLRVIWKCFCM